MIVDLVDSDESDNTESYNSHVDNKIPVNNQVIKEIGTKRPREVCNNELRMARLADKERSLQRTGYYKTKELSLVVGEDVRASNFGGALASVMLFQSEVKNFGFFEAKSSTPGLCRWTYRNYLDGGNGSVGEVGVTVLPLVVILFPPERFIDLVLMSDDGVNFTELSSEVRKIKSRLVSCESCPENTKVIIGLVDISQESVKYLQRDGGRCKRDRAESISNRIDAAIAHLLYEENVDVSNRAKEAEMCNYLESLTRVLGEQLYSEEKSAADTFRRIPIRYDADHLTDELKAYIDLRDTWIHMLQMVPGISKNRAECLASHYPTPQSLIDALNDDTVPLAVRKTMLQNKLDKSKNFPKLARDLFVIFTATDPTTPL